MCLQKMRLGSMDPALLCSGPMSTFSYDSHPISRGQARAAQQDELPRSYKAQLKYPCSPLLLLNLDRSDYIVN